MGADAAEEMCELVEPDDASAEDSEATSPEQVCDDVGPGRAGEHQVNHDEALANSYNNTTLDDDREPCVHTAALATLQNVWDHEQVGKVPELHAMLVDKQDFKNA